MTTLVMLGILLFGILGYRLLPVSDLPTVDFPTILVIAEFPGANSETMASAVAIPLERQFSTIAGLDSMNSTNTQGMTRNRTSRPADGNVRQRTSDLQIPRSTTPRSWRSAPYANPGHMQPCPA